ncbi:DUF1360 domain-containing protein [Streptomyces populi]
MVFQSADGGDRTGSVSSCSHVRPPNGTRHQEEDGPYAPGEAVPLGGYAVLAGVYGTATALAVLALRRSGRPLPSGVPPWDLLVLGTATYKVSRLVTKGKITSFLRAGVTRRRGAAGGSEVMDEPRGRGSVRQAVGELLSCPFCVSMWVATSLVGGYAAAPRAARLAAAGLSAVVVSDWLQYAWSYTQQRVDG